MAKTSEIDEALNLLEEKFELVNREMKNSNDIDKRIQQFKEILQNKDYTENSGFDATLFNSLIHSIIIGDKVAGDPNMVTFVYYSGLKSKMDLENLKNKKRETLLKNVDNDLCSLHNDCTHRNSLST